MTLSSLQIKVAQTQRRDHAKFETGMAFVELVAASAMSDTNLTEVPLRREDLTFTADGLTCNGNFIAVDEDARMRLFGRLGAPVSYWQKHSPGFQAQALSEHAKRSDFVKMFGTRPTAVLGNGTLFTIIRGELTYLPNGAVFSAIGEELGTESGGLLVSRIRYDRERLEVDLVSPAKATIIRKGDIVQAGISIIHARYGKQATQIQSFIYRLICENGMTRRECVSSDNGIARTRRLAEAISENSRELQLGQIRRLVRQNWNGLQAQLEALRATSERPAHVQELLTRWLQRARISPQNMMPRLLAAWREEGAEETHYGAVNALTRVATHDSSLTVRQRRVLASLGGLLAFSEVHLCEKCWSVLARSAAEESFAA